MSNTKTLIKAVRATFETFTNQDVCTYEDKIGMFREMFKFAKQESIEDLNKYCDVLDTCLDAGNDDLTDLTGFEIKELLEAIETGMTTEDDFNLELPSCEFRIIDGDEIDQIWTDGLIEQIKDCYDLSDLPKFVAIDWEKTAENCKVDGMGHHFASYDHNEHDAQGWHIFRTN